MMYMTYNHNHRRFSKRLAGIKPKKSVSFKSRTQVKGINLSDVHVDNITEVLKERSEAATGKWKSWRQENNSQLVFERSGDLKNKKILPSYYIKCIPKKKGSVSSASSLEISNERKQKLIDYIEKKATNDLYTFTLDEQIHIMKRKIRYINALKIVYNMDITKYQNILESSQIMLDGLKKKKEMANYVLDSLVKDVEE
jgi:hypothetical protein